jgi:hypothetical protein
VTDKEVHLAKQTDKSIREEFERLLCDNGVFKFGSYGWLDFDTHDPELIGHAMWQTNPPLGWDFLLGNDNPASKPPQLKEWQKFLAIAGADFEGLMIAARLSVGLALYQRVLVGEDYFNEDNLLQVHLMGAMVALSTASDRLRDVFIHAVFHKPIKKYANGEYSAPFNEAIDFIKAESDPLASSLAKLPSLTKDVQVFRQMRNRIIHKLATVLGRQHHQLVNNPISIIDPVEYEKIPEEVLRDAAEKAEAERQRQISDDLEQPIRWYKLLIEMSNHVFIVEHMLRN